MKLHCLFIAASAIHQAQAQSGNLFFPISNGTVTSSRAFGTGNVQTALEPSSTDVSQAESTKVQPSSDQSASGSSQSDTTTRWPEAITTSHSNSTTTPTSSSDMLSTLQDGTTKAESKSAAVASDSGSPVDTTTSPSVGEVRSSSNATATSTDSTGPGVTPDDTVSKTNSQLSSSATETSSGNLLSSATLNDFNGTTSTSQTTSGVEITLAPSVTASLNGSDIVIRTNTLVPGGSGLTSGTNIVSLGSSGILRIDSSTVSLSSNFGQPTNWTPTSSVAPITSTMTSMPTGVSTELLTDVTSNTWTTKTNQEDDSSTIAPVIWCPGCGAAGAAVVIVNWPKPPPGVRFSFPGIPSFELPCIPIPFVKDCKDTPPQGTDTEKDDEDENEDEPSSSSTDRSSTESSTSSSESCTSTTTASDCRVACSAYPTTIDNITVVSTSICYTTSCEQTVGCSVAATTSTSVTTSSGAACALVSQTLTPYNFLSAYSSAGISIPNIYVDPIPYTFYTEEESSTVDSESSSSTSSTDDGASITSSAEDTRKSSVIPAKSTISDTDGTSRASSTITSPSSTESSSTNGTTSHDGSSSRSSTALLTSGSSTSSSLSSASNGTSSSISHSSTSSTASATPTIALGEPDCRDESQFPDHGAVQPRVVASFNADFCNVNESTTVMYPDSDPITGGGVNNGIKYDFTIAWVDDCDLDEQAVRYPTGESDDSQDCYSAFSNAFGCNNGGVGGSVQAGCLRYTFNGGELTEEAAQNDGDDDSDDIDQDDDENGSSWYPETNEPTNLQCHSLDEFSRKRDVKAGVVSEFAEQSCQPSMIMSALDINPVHTTWSIDDVSTLWTDKVANYLYTYEWIENCQGPTQLSGLPMGTDSDVTCESMFRRTFDDCTGNQGIGGSIDVGCLRYTLHAGLNDETSDEYWRRGGDGTARGIEKS